MCADNDGDNFGGPGDTVFENGFRGADWCGRDWCVSCAIVAWPVVCMLTCLCAVVMCGKCSNDSDATVYPGRETTAYGPEVDHNCNGIYGTDSTTVRALCRVLCAAAVFGRL